MKISPALVSLACFFILQCTIFGQSDTGQSKQLNDSGQASMAVKDSAQAQDLSKWNSYTSHDVRAGERIFHGFVSSQANTVNCASCHNVQAIDTFNWNPSAYELGLKYKERGFNSFKSAIMEPTGQVMSRIHQNLNLTDEQIHQVKSYLTNLAIRGQEPLKPLKTNRILFFLLILVFVLSFVDLAFTHLIKLRLVHFAIMGISLLLITRYLVISAIDLGRSQDYQPDQPIKFSHAVHAGQNQTSCLYCHFNAERSKFAGIPPANVCTNCHVLVKEGTRSGKFEIAKIYDALEKNEPIKWVKIHNLPDFVFFSHSQHVVAGKIDCIQCHGDVTKMDQVAQVQDLSMGWCINCHRTTKVQFDNKFYGKYAELHKMLREGKITGVTEEQIGGTDCMKCHY